MNDKLEAALIKYLSENEQLMRDLKLVREIGVSDSYIAAGYLRNYMWDRLHGMEVSDRHNDIDVVYHDTSDLTEIKDVAIEKELIARTGNPKWSVKNQARMHVRNGHAPYMSLSAALSRWPETATAIAARLDDQNRIQIVCPHGLNDLFDMIVRRSPLFDEVDAFRDRVEKKHWKHHWPLLAVIGD